jgi:hypothetical protein
MLSSASASTDAKKLVSASSATTIAYQVIDDRQDAITENLLAPGREIWPFLTAGYGSLRRAAAVTLG